MNMTEMFEELLIRGESMETLRNIKYHHYGWWLEVLYMNKVTIAIINLFFPYHQDTPSSENKAVTGNIKTTVNLTKKRLQL